jgi:hypothetical protein
MRLSDPLKKYLQHQLNSYRSILLNATESLDYLRSAARNLRCELKYKRHELPLEAPTLTSNPPGRTALCLSGYFNSLKDYSSLGSDGYRYIKASILDRAETDIYIHTWDVQNAGLIEKLYKPWIKKFTVEPQISFKEVFYSNGLSSLPVWGTPFFNSLSQCYSIQAAFRLLYGSTNTNLYSCVIRSRFDLSRINRDSSGPALLNKYAVQCINFNNHYSMDRFYHAYWDLDLSEGPADMWFYSSPQNMIAFTELYDFVSKEVRVGNADYELFCRANAGGIVNMVKAWKWFFLNYGLWRIRLPLPTEYS